MPDAFEGQDIPVALEHRHTPDTLEGHHLVDPLKNCTTQTSVGQHVGDASMEEPGGRVLLEENGSTYQCSSPLHQGPACHFWHLGNYLSLYLSTAPFSQAFLAENPYLRPIKRGFSRLGFPNLIRAVDPFSRPYAGSWIGATAWFCLVKMLPQAHQLVYVVPLHTSGALALLSL